MIRLRALAVAFIISNEKVLMMERNSNRKLFPGTWAPVGGHLEANEFNDPFDACLREVYEETGLKEADFRTMEFKYIVLRRREDEIRVQYVYFIETDNTKLDVTEEGNLSWVPFNNVLDLNVTATTRYILEHYFNKNKKTDDILVGTVSNEEGVPVMTWAPLQDWEATSSGHGH